jgi:hypothetical protein
MTTDAEHLAQMHPWLRERVESALAAWRADAQPGETIRLVESVRSTMTQQKYFAEGRSRADGINKYSYHQFNPALAADVACIKDGKYVNSLADPTWQRWGKVAQAQGLEWGGAWRKYLIEGPHVQVSESQRIKLIQAKAGAIADGVWGPNTEHAIKGPFRSGRGWGRMTLAAWSKWMSPNEKGPG